MATTALRKKICPMLLLSCCTTLQNMQHIFHWDISSARAHCPAALKCLDTRGPCYWNPLTSVIQRTSRNRLVMVSTFSHDKNKQKNTPTISNNTTVYIYRYIFNDAHIIILLSLWRVLFAVSTVESVDPSYRLWSTLTPSVKPFVISGPRYPWTCCW